MPDGYEVPMSSGKRMTLRREPGHHQPPTYRCTVWSKDGHARDGFGGTSAELLETILAVEHMAKLVDQGLPGE